jgi:hypothetical protein
LQLIELSILPISSILNIPNKLVFLCCVRLWTGKHAWNSPKNPRYQLKLKISSVAYYVMLTQD